MFVLPKIRFLHSKSVFWRAVHRRVIGTPRRAAKMRCCVPTTCSNATLFGA